MLCKAVPASFDMVIQFVIAVGCIHLFFQSSGFDVLGMVAKSLQMEWLLTYVSYVTLVAAVYMLVCRFTGAPQTCKLHSIPGKVVVPIVSSPDGQPVIVNTDAITKAESAVKAATKAVELVKSAADAKDVSGTAQNAVTAVNAAVAASTAATTPLVLTADALRRSGMASASLV